MTVDVAPGALERVRALLNTWSIPNDESREPVDRLADLVANPREWRTVIGTGCQPSRREHAMLLDLRAGLRGALGQTHPVGLAPWISRLGVQPALTTADANAWPVAMVGAGSSCVGELLCIALDAVNQQVWHRLRACPECEYVFFDSSRSGQRTWCRMQREDPSGRSCGALVKARAKRARDRAARSQGREVARS